jgi:TonB family protein
MRAGVGRMIRVCAATMVVVVSVARVMGQTASALPNEWLVARTGPEVLAAAADVLRSMGAKFERQDLALGLLITRQMPYDARWPEAEALGLTAAQVPRAATLHIHVAPGFVPARLTVGAVLVIDTTFVPFRVDRARGDSTAFGHPELGRAIATRIAGRLGAALVAMPVDAEMRAREAARLGGGTCGPAPLYARGSKGPWPRLVSEVKPVYPRPQLEQHIGGVVQFSAQVTEHGTLTGLDWRQGIEESNLVAAARGAASLWRFAAPVVDGCPARRDITIEMSFRMTR